MSYLFDAVLEQHLSTALDVEIGTDFSVSAICRVDTDDSMIFCGRRNGLPNSGWQMARSTTNDNISFTFFGVAGYASNANVLPADGVERVATVVKTGSTMAFFVDGVAAGTASVGTYVDAGSGYPLFIGARSENGTLRVANLWNGLLSELAIWHGSIGTAGAAMLGKRISPRLILPSALAHHWSLIRGLQDTVGGFSATAQNGASVAQHPRIILPAAALPMKLAATEAGNTFTASAAVTVSAATASGSAEHDPPVYTATAAVVNQSATASGSAQHTEPTFTGTAEVIVANVTAAGSAQHETPTYTASAAVSTQPTTASGSAQFATETFTASAAVSTQSATASGSATHEPLFTASAAVTTSVATAVGTATHDPPVFTITTADVTVSNVIASGSATFAAGSVSGTAALLVTAATASGLAEFTNPPFTTAKIVQLTDDRFLQSAIYSEQVLMSDIADSQFLKSRITSEQTINLSDSL